MKSSTKKKGLKYITRFHDSITKQLNAKHAVLYNLISQETVNRTQTSFPRNNTVKVASLPS